MKNKFLSRRNLLFLVPILQLVIGALPYFGIHPPKDPMNPFSKIWKLLWIDIPLIWVIFIFTIIFIITTYLRKKTKIKSSGTIMINDSKKDTLVQPKEDKKLELGKEHYFILLTLLDNQNLSCQRSYLENQYKSTFNKNTADFNILRQELLDQNLIYEINSYYGYIWKLTSSGLKVAKEKYRIINKNNK